jgi:hypothetical protein
MMSPLLWLLLTVSATIGPSFSVATTATNDAPPSFLFILGDDIGWADFSCA